MKEALENILTYPELAAPLAKWGLGKDLKPFRHPVEQYQPTCGRRTE